MKTIYLILLLFISQSIFSQKTPELITNVDTSNYNQWQLALGSQDYDTNYGIYIKMIKVSGSNPKMKFKIVNYKGHTNLGISKVIMDGKKDKIYIIVQALNSTKETNVLTYNGSLIKDKILVLQKVVLPMFKMDTADMNKTKYANLENEINKLKKLQTNGTITRSQEDQLKSLMNEKGAIYIKDLTSLKITGNLRTAGLDDIMYFNARFKKSKEFKQLSSAKIKIENDNDLNLTDPEFQSLTNLEEKLGAIVDNKFFYVDNTYIRAKREFEVEEDPEKLAGLRCMQGNNKIKN